MDVFSAIFHIDEYIALLFDAFGMWTYMILFFVIFMETGFVVTPFLPGDSLLFAAGTFAALGFLDIITLYIVLLTAAVLGDSINYFIGDKFGEKAFRKSGKLLNQKHLKKTENFYKKHGGKTIVIARFIPVVRTFAPFVAGVGSMEYRRFLSFNLLGGFLWVTIFLFAGYFFGNIPVIANNFELAMLGIVILSVVPLVIEKIKS